MIKLRHLKYYLKWYFKNIKPASIRFLRIKGFISPIDNRGIQIGDKVKIIDPEMNYEDHIGIVVDNNAQSVYDDFTIKVEFPDIPPGESSFLSIFTEYFQPDELEIMRELNGNNL